MGERERQSYTSYKFTFAISHKTLGSSFVGKQISFVESPIYPAQMTWKDTVKLCVHILYIYCNVLLQINYAVNTRYKDVFCFFDHLFRPLKTGGYCMYRIL